MNATDIHRDLDKLRAKVPALESQRAEYVGRRDSALAVEPRRFDQNHVDIVKRRLAHVEQEIANVQERIAALESQLPTPEDTRLALAEADAASEQVRSAHNEFNAAWPRFMAQIEAVVAAARAVTAAASDGRTASAKLRDLVARFALDVQLLRDVPPVDPNDVQIAATVCEILQGVIYHQVIDDQAHQALSAFLARRAESVAV